MALLLYFTILVVASRFSRGPHLCFQLIAISVLNSTLARRIDLYPVDTDLLKFENGLTYNAVDLQPAPTST